MKKRLILKILFAIAFLCLSVLWLKEFTQRRARHTADEFMGQTLTRVGWNHDRLIPVFWRDPQGTLQWPGWYISYSTYFAFGEPLSIYVDVFGRIRTANSQQLINLIALSEDERCKKQEELVKADINYWEKRDKEREQRKAEKSNAALSNAP